MTNKNKTMFRSRRWVWLVAGLCAVMMLPWPAGAVKQTSPLTVTTALDNPNPELGRNETLRVSLSTTQPYANLAIAVHLPPEIALISGNPEWKGALNAGEKREIVLTVMLKTAGRYTINIDAAFDPAESAISATRMSLNIIAENTGVTASAEPFTVLDLKRAKTKDDRKRILGAQGVETQKPAPSSAPAAVPSFLQPADQKEKPAAPAKPESRLGDSISVQVSGVMTYKDTAGAEHPIRFAKVEIIDADVAFDDIMGQTYTGPDGSYAVTATGGDVGSGPDIKVRVYSAIMNDAVASIGPDASSAYYMESGEYSDYGSSSLIVSLVTGQPVRGSGTDDESARRFSVLDAMLQAAIEAYALRNSSLMPKITVIFPVGGSVSYYSPSAVTLNILRADALDWDVLFHEYGHFLSDKGSSSRFDNSPGGSHSGGSTIPAHGKSDGIRLAWSEGWATFFGIEAQFEPTQNLLAMPNVPNAGDRTYHDTEDMVLTSDLETVGYGAKGQGYASENSVMAALYDLCDGDIDTSPDGLSSDIVNITPKQIWNVINTGDWDDVGKFYNVLCALAGYDIGTLLYFSPVFAMNNIGPELSAPAEGTTVSSAISPQFSWQANGDPTAGYAHNRFDLVIGKNNFATIVGVKENIQNTNYTFTDAEWQAITGQSDDTGIFQWVVAGYNSVDPRIPSSAGLGKFISNKQNFKLRAYHIRLTWTTLGADVDLHFTNPSGSDCYYSNRNPDWGVAGDTSDDPSLDRDCITTCTEENITISKVVDRGDYQIWVHYYSDHGMGATTATVEIFKYGRLIAASSQGLSETGDRWNVFDFLVSKSDEPIAAERPGDLIRGVTGLPPKQQED